jgi:hypothetical protein
MIACQLSCREQWMAVQDFADAVAAAVQAWPSLLQYSQVCRMSATSNSEFSWVIPQHFLACC